MIRVLFIFLFITTQVFSQDLEPVQIVKMLLNKPESKKLDKYFKGEFQGHPNGDDFGKKHKYTVKTLTQTSSKAVVNVTLKDRNGSGADVYYHFEMDGHWKITAFRALAMTGIIARALERMEKIKPEDVDSIVKNQDPDYAIFETAEDFHFQLINMRLILAFDDELVQHYHDNERVFNTLRDDIETFVNEDGFFEQDMDEVFEERLNNLGIKSLSENKLYDGIMDFSLGGMLDNTVGYLYLSDKSLLPEPNPENLIMVREIGNGWYIYKTT